jgi:hypothetical protein
MSTQSSFLNRLQAEAALQSQLHQRRFLPHQLDGLTSLIGNYPWQIILVVSGVTALFMEFLKVW